MAVSSKHKRRIRVGEKDYLWYVADDLESFGFPALTVLTPDKRFIVRYCLTQPDERRHVVVLGPEFAGEVGRRGGWRRYRCPAFGDLRTIRPADVRSFVTWCQSAVALETEVDASGRSVAVT